MTKEGVLKTSVNDDVQKLNSLLNDKYEVIEKIGEGTFSSVYKSIDIKYAIYDNNSWTSFCNVSSFFIKKENNGYFHKVRYVAIKNIYMTSSPERIKNEINILHTLG
jgi:cell division control protein 7